MVTLTHLHVCCGGFNTRAGSIIIGVLCMVSSLFVILASALTLSGREGFYRKKDAIEVFTTLALQDSNRFGVVLQIIFSILEIVISGLMVWGAIKKAPRLVYLWVMVNIVQTGLVALVLLSMVIYLIVIGSLEAALVVAIAEVLFCAFHAYLILVVNSFHTTIKTGNEPPPYEIENIYHHPKEQGIA